MAAVFFAQSLDLFMVTDNTLRIVKVNPAWTKTMGWPAADLVGKHIFKFVHPDDLDQVKLDLLPLQDGEDAVTYAHRMEHAAGHTIWVQVSLTALKPSRSSISSAPVVP